MMRLVEQVFRIHVATEGDVVLVCDLLQTNSSRCGVMDCLDYLAKGLCGCIESEEQARRLLKVRQSILRGVKKRGEAVDGEEMDLRMVRPFCTP